MELNEVMENEEVIDVATEEIVKASSGNGFKKAAAGFGLGVLAGIAICKLARPIVGKLKSMCNRKAVIVDCPHYAEEHEFEETEEEPEGTF